MQSAVAHRWQARFFDNTYYNIFGGGAQADDPPDLAAAVPAEAEMACGFEGLPLYCLCHLQWIESAGSEPLKGS